MQANRIIILIFCVWIAVPGEGASSDVNLTDGVWGDWEQDITAWRESVTLEEIQINKAWITIKSQIPDTVHYYWQHGQCFGCEPILQTTIVPSGNFSALINGEYSATVQVRAAGDGHVICGTERWLAERGEYWLIVTSPATCVLVLANDPPIVYLPILWAFLILVGLAVIWILLSCAHEKHIFDKLRPGHGSQDLDQLGEDNLGMEMPTNKPQPNTTHTGPAPSSAATPPSGGVRKRLRSLDTFRGFCLVVMIYVNYGYSSHYYFFRHAYWDGALMVADLVFPWFVFIMGTSMAFSFRGLLKRRTPYREIIWKILTRTIKLFALGIFLSQNPDLSTLRIPGVLQRFSITYVVVAFTHLPFAKAQDTTKGGYRAIMRDVTDYWVEWIIMLGLLALHLGLTFGLPVPGCPTGYIGPGGLHEGRKYYNCSGGAALYVDLKIFGEEHIYQWPDIKGIYKTEQPFDPEGTLGCLTSIFMCFLGLQLGKIIITYQTTKCRVIRWTIWGAVLCAVGIGLSEAKITGGLIPLNKNLWSVSFVLLLAGMGFFAVTLCYLFIDILQVWNGAPFFYPGMNSIVIYACHSIFAGYFPVTWVMPDPSLHWQRVFMSLWGCGVWCVVAFIMYKKNIFVAL